ncbi:MAG TPA: patatin-like phospholipase family protein [Blastocatellia bacterium]|nr:patatin-like phospholipase family protein [Blastocatellia bacterium]
MIADNQELSRRRGRVGLVLSGGGAKGAYQVGVIKCLADYGIQIDAVAGASVGALNGALLASAIDLREAAVRLEKIWTTIALSPPVEIQMAQALPDIVMKLSFSLLLAASRPDDLTSLGEAVRQLAHYNWPTGKAARSDPTIAAAVDLFAQSNLYDKPSLVDMIDHFLDDELLANGLPLYVSVFKSKGTLMDLGWAAAGAFGLAETPDSEFIHVQSRAKAEFRTLILASAALPLVFEAQTIGGQSYADGGIGGWLRAQGKTPVTPLLRDAGCQYVIVTHLIDGSLWNRHDFTDAVTLEVRPSNPIARKGGLGDTLGFNPSLIADWMQQGYEDAEKCLLSARSILEVVSVGRKAQLELNEALSRLNNSKS